MRRLAHVLAAVLAVTAAPSARAEPLDLDLTRLGAPDPDVWGSISTGGNFAQLATESRQRFAVLSTEMALALSSAILHPASTTGHSGFAVDLEVATVPVHAAPVGVAPPLGFTNKVWPTESTPPSQLYLPSIHVRKALPWSLEFGGRLIYLSSSSYYAAQGEAKWALNEGFEYVPDLGVRFAYTRLFGQKDWNLGATDIDFLVSKRWGVNAVTSFTPYLSARFTYVSASTERMDFAPALSADATDPVDAMRTQAAFPRFAAGFYRTTLGLRMTAYSVSLAVEGTLFGGASPSVSEYDGVKIASSLAGAAKLGWEF
jgi:hypothetical protein